MAGDYLQRARDLAAKAGILVTNHALLLNDARMKGALLPASGLDQAMVIRSIWASMPPASRLSSV